MKGTSMKKIQLPFVDGVSELVEIRANMKALAEREKELCAQFKDMGVGVYTDGKHTIAVSEAARKGVNLEAMRVDYADIVAKFEYSTNFYKIMVVS
jgi:hypothetical protein